MQLCPHLTTGRDGTLTPPPRAAVQQSVAWVDRVLALPGAFQYYRQSMHYYPPSAEVQRLPTETLMELFH